MSALSGLRNDRQSSVKLLSWWHPVANSVDGPRFLRCFSALFLNYVSALPLVLG